MSYFPRQKMPESGFVAIDKIGAIVTRGETREEVNTKLMNIFRGLNRSDRAVKAAIKRDGVEITEIA